MRERMQSIYVCRTRGDHLLAHLGLPKSLQVVDDARNRFVFRIGREVLRDLIDHPHEIVDLHCAPQSNATSSPPLLWQTIGTPSVSDHSSARLVGAEIVASTPAAVAAAL